MSDPDAVERIVQQTLEAVNSGRDGNLNTRVALVESQFAGLNKSIDQLTHIMQDTQLRQNDLKDKFDERVDQFTTQVLATIEQTTESLSQRLDAVQQQLADSGKFDMRTVASYAGTIVTIVAGFWGLAIRPIDMKQENFLKDLGRLQQQQETLQSKLTEHEKLVTHAGTKVLLDAVNKQMDELREKVDRQP